MPSLQGLLRFYAVPAVYFFSCAGAHAQRFDAPFELAEAAAPDAGVADAVVDPLVNAVRTAATIIVPAGSALFVKISRMVDLKRGTAIECVLLRPLYIYDRQVLTLGAVLRGTVSNTAPLSGTLRMQAVLNGDVTPLRTPVVGFDRVVTAGGEVPLVSVGLPRGVRPVRFVAADERPGLFSQARTAIRQDREHEVILWV